MTAPFRGVVNLDVRDSVPDWAPYEQPKAAAGTPNVVYIVLDDVGFAGLSCYGGMIETPNIDRIAARGVRYNEWHTTALCSPTRSCLLTGRNHTTNGMACITEGAAGFPNGNGHIPPECATLAEMLVERGFSTAAVGKWHLTAEDEMNMASTKANWPLGRGFERFYGFLGAETNQWYPDLIHDNHPVEQPYSPEEGYHLSVDLTDQAIAYIDDVKSIAPDRPVFLYYAPGCAHAPHHVPKEWIDKYKGRFDAGYEQARETMLAKQKELGIVSQDTELPPVNPLGTPQTRVGPNGEPFPALDETTRWDTHEHRRAGVVLADGRGLRGIPVPRRRADRPPRRPSGGDRPAGQHHHHRGLGQRRQRRGRTERLGQRDAVHERHPGHHGQQHDRPRRARRSQDLQPLLHRLGDGLQHPVQDVEALRLLRGRHRRPVHLLLAGRHQGPG